LIVDDELSICVTLAMALEAKYEVQYATDAEAGLKMLQQQSFHLVFLDLRIGERDGMEVLERIKETDSTIAVIIITAYGSIDSSVEAMKRGAFTYLSKPLHIDEAMICVEQALSFRSLNERVQYLTDELQTRGEFFGMVGKSPAMRRVYEMIEKLRDVDIGVTVSGESGTGKELAARAIHFSGNRKNERFVAVNCAAIPEGLLEEELFGHKKGSFTGAVFDKIGKFSLADKGTIFLDEISDLPLSMQSKVLRVLQEKVFTPIGSNEPRAIDIRVVAATNRDLIQMVQNGTFRLDLFYRINVASIVLPPLRERRQDIPLLCRYFIELYNKEHRKNVQGLTKGAERLLLEYDYPGNVRELSNALEYAVVVCDGDVIQTRDLLSQMRQTMMPGAALPQPETNRAGLFAGMTLREIEEEIIRYRLRENNGHQKQTAQQLGISVKGLRNKIRAYGIAGR
jgi:two-component system response regulator AtoC